MTDSAVAASECKVNSRISHEQLQELLGVIQRAYTFDTEPPSVQDASFQLSAEFFDHRFATTTSFFYVNPFQAERDAHTAPNILTREDIIKLFESILESIRLRELGDSSRLNTEQSQVLTDIKNGLPNNKQLLERKIPILAAALFTMAHAEEKNDEGQEPEVVTDIPAKLLTLLGSNFNLVVSWPYIKEIVTDADHATKNPFGVKTISTTVDQQPVLLPVIKLRNFLNDWLKEVYAGEVQKSFDRKHLEFPKDAVYYISSERSAGFIDREEWNDTDSAPGVKSSAAPTQFIRYVLGEKIEEFLKIEEPDAPPAYASQSTESAESDSSVTKEKTKEEQLDLLQKFEQAGASYTLEANRLTAILLPQFFGSHGISARNLNELEQFDPIDFLVIEREFRLELENVLRSLRPEEFGLLKERGAQLEFRYLILKKLYAKLGTNPRFIGSILRYRDSYIDQLPPAQARELEKILNLTDDAFDSRVYNEQKTTDQEWGQDFKAVSGDQEKLLSTLPLQNLSGLNALTAEDLKTFITFLSKNEAVNFETLQRNLDVLIAERWSPEQVRGLDATDASVILGISLPGSLTHDPASFKRFLNLIAEYLYARRQRLADHYELDAISREKSGQRDKDGNLTPYTPAALAALQSSQALAETHKDAGGGEAIIVAKSSATDRRSEYAAGGHSFSTSIEAIHGAVQKEKDAQIQAEHQQRRNAFDALSLDQKRELLARLGVLTTEIDDVRTNKKSQDQYLHQQLESGLSRRYAEFQADSSDLSLYEQEDEAVVQDQGGYSTAGQPKYRPAGIQRYGRPSLARSLMKGALKLKKPFAKTKNNADKALMVMSAVAERGEQALATAVMGPLGQNKYVRRGIIAALASALVAVMSYVINGGILTKIGALLGGIAGGAAGFTIGGVAAIPGAIGGSLVGAAAGYGIEERLGFHPKATFNGPGLGGGAAVNGAPAAKASATLNSLQAQSGLGSSLTQVAAASGTLAYVSTSAMLVYSSLIGGLQQPPLGTIGSDGQESPYVILTKTSVQGAQFDNSKLPGSVTYQIFIEAKDNYSLEVTDLHDEMSVKLNDGKRTKTESPPPTPSCPNVNFAQLQKKVFTKDDGKFKVAECVTNFDGSYHDAGVLNKLNIKFNVTQTDGTIIKDQTAETAEIICFGECPQFQTGGWPTHGVELQGPYGTFSHAHSDAIDFARVKSDKDNVIIYATFPGTAWFFKGNSLDPALKGVDPNYGNHVVLVTNDGFVFLYGHLREFSSQFEVGKSYPVQPCTELGIMGTTGNSTGVHLHYEYRVYAGRSWYSYPAGGRRILETHIPQPYQEGLQVQSDCGPATK